MACNELSRNHITAQDHVACTFVKTHPLIYKVLGYVTQHFVEIPRANHVWSRYLSQILTKYMQIVIEKRLTREEGLGTERQARMILIARLS